MFDFPCIHGGSVQSRASDTRWLIKEKVLMTNLKARNLKRKVMGGSLISAIMTLMGVDTIYPKQALTTWFCITLILRKR